MFRNVLFIFAIFLLLGWGAYILYGNQLQELVNNINLDGSWEYHYYDKSTYDQYENQDFYVDFLYPKDYEVLDEVTTPFIKGAVLTVIAIPPENFSNTNLQEAYFVLAAGQDENLADGCLAPMPGETTAGTDVIRSNIFNIFKTQDAAMGSVYETTTYRLDKNEICYEAMLYLHYGNYEVIDPSSGIEEFDKIDIENKLQDILMELNIE